MGKLNTVFKVAAGATKTNQMVLSGDMRRKMLRYGEGFQEVRWKMDPPETEKGFWDYKDKDGMGNPWPSSHPWSSPASTPAPVSAPISVAPPAPVSTVASLPMSAAVPAPVANPRHTVFKGKGAKHAVMASSPAAATTGSGVSIGSNVSMGSNVSVGSNVITGPNVNIGPNVMPPTDPMDFPAEKGLSPRHTVFKGKGAKHAVMASAAPSVPPKINMPKPSMPAMVSNSAKGFAMSAMEQVGLTVAGGVAGGVASYSTGGDFNQGAMIGGGIAGGLTLGAGAVARKLGQDGISASGYTGALGNLLSGFEDANVRRAMIGGGGLLGGMAFGGTRSHSQGFNKNRGTKIGH